MLGYYLQLAWQNLRRSPWLAALIVLIVGVGIGSSMTVYSMLDALSRDPIPHKSAVLFAPRMDATGRGVLGFPMESGRMNYNVLILPYRDAMALRDARLATRQAVMYSARYSVASDEPEARPVDVAALATHADIFAMFDLSFRSGRAWDNTEDDEADRVVVLSATLAEKLFPGTDATEQTVRLDGHSYRVVGVTEPWAPQPHFHATRGGGDARLPMFSSADELFLPLAAAVAQYRGRTPTTGAHDCTREKGLMMRIESRQDWLEGDCLWTSLWVEMETPAQVRHYADFLQGYAEEQTRSGRFDWTPRSRLYSLPEVLGGVGPALHGYRMAALAGFGFLLVCLINAVGLMLARFHARAPELALHRALGAPRHALFRQCLAETALIGIAGGLLGLALLAAGSGAQRALLPAEVAWLVGIDVRIAVVAIALAMLGTICAGIYPAWKASSSHAAGHGLARRRNRHGAVLMGAQIALTLGLVSNALFVAWGAIQAIRQPSGMDEANVFSFSSRWPTRPDDLFTRIESDLAMLRKLPGVMGATGTSGIPLLGGVGGPMTLEPQGPDTDRSRVPATRLYHVDNHALDAFGLRLVDGRWFDADEFRQRGNVAAVCVITRSFADRMFPDGDAVRRRLYGFNPDGMLVVGIVERVDAGGADHAMFLPIRHTLTDDAISYVVRAQPGRLVTVMRQAEELLRKADPVRVLSPPQPFAETRRNSNKTDRNLASTLLAVCVLLVAVIALGIVGITHYWVSQRRAQIGIRRALGAPRSHILLHFQGENLAIVGVGVAVGALLALAGNLWLVRRYEMPRIEAVAVLAGAVIVVLIAQFAVLWPALRASLIPPAVATRTT